MTDYERGWEDCKKATIEAVQTVIPTDGETMAFRLETLLAIKLIEPSKDSAHEAELQAIAAKVAEAGRDPRDCGPEVLASMLRRHGGEVIYDGEVSFDGAGHATISVDEFNRLVGWKRREEAFRRGIEFLWAAYQSAFADRAALQGRPNVKNGLDAFWRTLCSASIIGFDPLVPGSHRQIEKLDDDDDDCAPPGLSLPACLVAEFDMRSGIPVFSRLFFASSRPEGLSHSMSSRLFLVAEEEAIDGRYYGGAEKTLRKMILSNPFYAWCRPLLPESADGG